MGLISRIRSGLQSGIEMFVVEYMIYEIIEIIIEEKPPK